MKNLPCVLWLIGSQFAASYSEYVNEYLLKNVYSDNVHFIAAITCMLIWAFVGIKLYHPSEK